MDWEERGRRKGEGKKKKERKKEGKKEKERKKRENEREQTLLQRKKNTVKKECRRAAP